MPELEGWDSFYVIVGTAAGALIGLQFVVMTLIAERPALRIAEASAAFSAPTIVHFSVVLFLSAMLRAPWHTVTPPALLFGLVGIGGVLYAFTIVRHARAQTVYKPDVEDLVYYLLLPGAAYLTLLGAAIAVHWQLRGALFAVGAAALLLLFIGIHNAWDNISYHVMNRE